MSFLKASLSVLGAVFFFALGVTFHSSLGAKESVREPASQAAPDGAGGARFDSRASQAFKACLNSRVANGSVLVSKASVEGRRWSIVSIPCAGKPAKALFDSIQHYSTEEFVRYRDKRRGSVRFFGSLYPPSQCAQIVSEVKGRERLDYSCSIRIDVDSEITEQLKL